MCERFLTLPFRFVDVLPCLTSGKMLTEHVSEYFTKGENVPTVLKLGAKNAEMGGKNAVIVDDDADLDEAVPHIIDSATSTSTTAARAH